MKFQLRSHVVMNHLDLDKSENLMKQNIHFLTYEFAHNAVQKRKEERSLKVGGVFILWN